MKLSNSSKVSVVDSAKAANDEAIKHSVVTAFRKPAQVAAELILQTKALRLAHEDFTERYITRSHTALYELLSNMLTTCLILKETPDRNAVIKRLREHLRWDLKVKTQKNTSYVTLIVRCVVQSNRKTAHLYSRALQRAIDAKVTAQALPEFIASNGGVEGLRRTEVDEDRRNIAARRTGFLRAALAKELLARQAEPIGVVQYNGGQRVPAYASDVKFTLLIGVTERSSTNEVSTKIVGSVYPHSKLEYYALQEYLGAIGAAAKDWRTFKFDKVCKDGGLNTDMLIKWAAHDGFATHTAALAFCKRVDKAAKALEAEELAKAQEKAA